MTSTRPADILRHLEPSGVDDRTLAGRYASHGDQAAFAELVRRHGPLVWAACLRVAGHKQDAEDAFQAVFLVLVRKLAAIGNLDLLGNWLYGVAVRVAMRARRTAARRRTREVQVPTMPDPPDPRGLTQPGSDLGPILDEELAALASHYREAIVLCDLRGASREEAAKLLGVPEGTLSSRLANGRKKLAERLARRGVALSAAAVPGVLADAARAAVPVELAARVQHLATGAAVPVAVARLASGGFSVKTSLFVGMMCAAAVAGAVYAATPGDPPRPNDPPNPPVVVAERPQPAPEPKTEPQPAAEVAAVPGPRMRGGRDLGVKGVHTFAWSPDGRRLAVEGTVTSVSLQYRAVSLYDADGESAEYYGSVPLDAAGHLVGFTPGGEMVTDVREHELVSGFHRLKIWEPKWNESPSKWQRRAVELESHDAQGYVFAADGKSYRTAAYVRDAAGAARSVEAFEVDARTGKTLKSLLKVEGTWHAISSEGKRLAVLHGDKLTVYDLDRGAKVSGRTFTEKLPEGFPPPALEYLVFSPDGRLLLVARGMGLIDVVDADTGEALPAVAGREALAAHPDRYAFSADGTLLATLATRYTSLRRLVGGGAPGSVQREQVEWRTEREVLSVWDTRTGKLVKQWRGRVRVAFHPSRPVLAILEPNGESATRLGLWDFAAEVEKK